MVYFLALQAITSSLVYFTYITTYLLVINIKILFKFWDVETYFEFFQMSHPLNCDFLKYELNKILSCQKNH